jgi:hypothetical protein
LKALLKALLRLQVSTVIPAQAVMVVVTVAVATIVVVTVAVMTVVIVVEAAATTDHYEGYYSG